jgi:hypothetical protein
MTVVLSKATSLYRIKPSATCTFCGGPLHVPFVEWRAAPPVYICQSCCVMVGNGIMADITRVRAISELHHLGYPHMTLERGSVHEHERRHQKDPRAEAAINKRLGHR